MEPIPDKLATGKLSGEMHQYRRDDIILASGFWLLADAADQQKLPYPHPILWDEDRSMINSNC